MYRLISWQKGYKEYLTGNLQDFTTNRAQAAIFTGNEQADYPHLWREDLSEAERMERQGVAMLPGLEL